MNREHTDSARRGRRQLNCATVSCPDLPPEPFMGKKDADVIERDLGGLSAIVHHYPDPATCDGFECHGSIFVCSFERDWTLNDTALTHNTSHPHT